MARLWRILVAALTGLLIGGPGWGATPGRVCRTACAARITAACAATAYGHTGGCKRKLLRACRRTTSEVACATAAEAIDTGLAARIDAALANRRVVATTRRGATTSTNDITLCGSHGVRLHATTSSPGGDNDETLDGTWAIELLASATPVLSLRVGESTPRRFAVALDDDGTPFFYGFGTTTEDASGACTAPVTDG
jgi:hypothetical protein